MVVLLDIIFIALFHIFILFVLEKLVSLVNRIKFMLFFEEIVYCLNRGKGTFDFNIFSVCMHT